MALIVMAVVVALLFGAYHWLVSTAHATLRRRLTEHGLNRSGFSGPEDLKRTRRRQLLAHALIASSRIDFWWTSA